MGKQIFLGLVFLLAFQISSAQEIVTDGYFHEDSMKVGEEIHFTLYAKYPKSMEVIFPDSTFGFFPFEYYNKQYFPTKTDSIYAYDSAVYSFASFEIDSIQYLKLPVFLLNGKDSIEITHYEDSIYLDFLVIQMPDSLEFKENLAFQEVKLDFNYPYLMIGLVILLIVIIVLFFVFGETVKKKIKSYRLRKAYEKFSSEFEKGINKIRKSDDKVLIEEVLVVWKKYMEKLEDRPFTKYTTREIAKAGYGGELQSVLKSIDRAIYSSMDSEAMYKNFEKLEDYTLEKYQEKQKEVR